jgi:rod shape-determining protein MreD
MNILHKGKSSFGIKKILPFITVLFLIIIMVLPYQYKIIANTMPFLTLIGIYYWSFFKPNLLPIGAVFVLGLLQDTLLGSPFGLMSLLLIVAQQFIFFQSRHFLEKNFIFNFFIYIMLVIGFGFLSWGITSLYFGVFLDYWEVIIQILLTIALYPIIKLTLSLNNKS